MSNNVIQIVYACNDKIWEGLYLSILSVARRTKRPVHFYLLTADLSEVSPLYVPITKEHEKLIKDMVKDFNPQNEFIVVDCKKAYYEYMEDNKIKKNFHTPFTGFRLLLEKIKIFNGKVLYLDVDTMANDDIAVAYDVEMGNNEMCVVHDIAMHRKNNHKYFNAGVILFNMDVIYQTHLLDKAFKYLIENKPLYHDQDSLNYSWTNIMFFPQPETRFNYQKTKVKKDTVIKHFISARRLIPWHFGIKQWHINRVQKILHIHNWDEDYKYFLEKTSQNKKPI